uniref:C2H2-type domain-containing protein n=1 Tax=Chenopodium quinoa TaxID=63459 RepID=A0A803L0A0_CHEQI
MAKTTNPRKLTKEVHRTRRSQPPSQREDDKEKQQSQSQQQSQALPSWVRPETASPETLQRKSRGGPTHASTSTTSSSSHEGSNRSIKSPVLSDLSNTNGVLLKSSSSNSTTAANYSIKGIPFRRLSGCYECRMVVDPVLSFTRDPSLRATICSCPHCGEVFMKPENLELHQAVRHAVSELGPEDTSKNIVEIIFQSSWLKKQTPVCKIDRILKVHNTQKTINKFEEYRDSIKFKATRLPKKHARCIADGNELLSIIKNGFKLADEGPTGKDILTTATSGRAHDRADVGSEEQERRAMLVCRVIAGRVKKSPEGGGSEEYDSVAGATGVYSNLDELYVFNPKAILPCFVVIYRGF